MSGVICDKMFAAQVKRKVYKWVVRTAVLFSLETAAPTWRREAELKTLSFSLGVKTDRNRNE